MESFFTERVSSLVGCWSTGWDLEEARGVHSPQHSIFNVWCPAEFVHSNDKRNVLTENHRIRIKITVKLLFCDEILRQKTPTNETAPTRHRASRKEREAVLNLRFSNAGKEIINKRNRSQHDPLIYDARRAVSRVGDGTEDDTTTPRRDVTVNSRRTDTREHGRKIETRKPSKPDEITVVCMEDGRQDLLHIEHIVEVESVSIERVYPWWHPQSVASSSFLTSVIIVMRVLILAVGSRGDVEPSVASAQRIQNTPKSKEDDRPPNVVDFFRAARIPDISRPLAR